MKQLAIVVGLMPGLVGAGTTGVAASGAGRVQAQPAEPSPDVVVTGGEAVIRVTPDQAFVTLAVESRARTPRDAQNQNAETMTAVQQKLREAGLPADAVRTVAIELSPEFDYANGRQIPRGFVARNSVEVRVDELAQLGQVIDSAVGTGATNVTGVRFDIKRRDALEREALRQAVADAKARAEALAAGAGRTLGTVLRIEDDGRTGPPPPRPMMMAVRSESAADAPTPVAPGELEIRARVTLTAALR